MIGRILLSHLGNSLSEFPVVVISGPRQAGKTTLAKYLMNDYGPAHYLDLELPSHYARLRDSEGYLREYKDHLVIIDEIQRNPDLIPLIRALVDEDRKPGRFLLLGSSSGRILQHSSESLAGRVEFLELTPFLLPETDYKLRLHWWRGGFPEAFMAATDQHARRWYGSFIRTYIERDFPLQGTGILPSRMRQLFQMLAHLHGHIVNLSDLARSLDVSSPTIHRYMDILEDAMLIRRLPPWHINIKKRLVKSPKVYIRDSGVLHSLLSIPDFDHLYGHPKLGYSWEGYVVEQIAGLLPEDHSIYFYRTHKGAEVDLIITKGLDIVQVIEIKFSNAPVLEKGFYYALEDLGSAPVSVIYFGEESYNLNSAVRVTSLSEFLRKLNK